MSGILATLGGSSPSVRVSISPTSQNVQNGTTASRAFTESVTVVGGTPSSYTWSISSPVGTWNITAGQGTASGTATVSGTSIGPDYTCNLNCAVVVNGVTYNVSAPLDYARVS